jgi:quercetin dioxygenase-like cupin family protein/DNA-binding Xre family transcriptional regulator
MNVGKRICKMREAQDMSREHLAKMVGLSATQLKAVEEGKSVPSIGLVLKLSRALGSKMGSILHEGGARAHGDLFSVVHAGAGKSVKREGALSRRTGQGYSYQSLLGDNVRGQGMEPFLVEFDPTAAATVEPMTHQGEEFLHVLSGTLELLYDGENHTLKKGDSIYIDSSKPHSLRGLGKTPPQMLAVILSKD